MHWDHECTSTDSCRICDQRLHANELRCTGSPLMLASRPGTLNLQRRIFIACAIKSRTHTISGYPEKSRIAGWGHPACKTEVVPKLVGRVILGASACPNKVIAFDPAAGERIYTCEFMDTLGRRFGGL
jgi:hypothetical protein